MSDDTVPEQQSTLSDARRKTRALIREAERVSQKLQDHVAELRREMHKRGWDDDDAEDGSAG